MATRKTIPLSLQAKLLLLGLLALSTFGVNYVARMRHAEPALARIFDTEAAAIREIVIRPAAAPYQTPLSRAVMISLPDQILKSSDLLRQSERFYPDHPAARWQCHIEVVTADGSTFGTICQTENQGVILYVHSNQVDGWNYGSYRNDALADWVNDVAHASGSSRGKPKGSTEMSPDQ